jgi:Omp85 superfamily domain/WD40-like Beta Propeller Repeat
VATPHPTPATSSSNIEVTVMRASTGRAWSLLPAAIAVLLLAPMAGELSAQTGYIPYFGKNRIHYDTFRWHIYTTDHFEIYYYPEMEQHLERVSAYAESAYQHVSTELKHELGFKVPLVLFKTHAEFQQQNVSPTEVPEGVAAFAEPQRDRMVLPIDEPPDQLYRLITHELTHVFQFDIIPRSLVRRGFPLWIDEGMADYMAGVWSPMDMMMVRDVAVADIVPKMTEFEEYGGFSNPRITYNLGHAAFEFMESKWGKEGIRQFVFSLRKSVIGGGNDAFEEAFRVKPEEFDQQFEKYLKDRFKPFRDKERPLDYGRNLAPDERKTKYSSVLTIEPSPSGDLFAAVVGNRKDYELDVVLLSTKDGAVIRNLTPGFDKDRGFEYIAIPGSRWISVPWMSWSPVGDRLAYFVRTEKHRTLIVQNVVTGKTEQRVKIEQVDAPESPEFSPDGKSIVFSALQNAIGDIYKLDLATGETINLTKDDFADYAPTYSPDGKYLVYLARISGNNKLFRLDLDSGKKTQLTFGTHDEAAASFLDDKTLAFGSTATDPTKPISPEDARNGNIYNIWTLNLTTNELRQYTDALTANLSVVTLKESGATKVAFVTYFKMEYGVHAMEPKQPVSTVASSDFGEPGPIIDFQPPLSHTLVKSNQRRKGTFEKLFLDGRPPIAVGVTSGGDLFGGSQVTFSDVLGDQQFNLYVASVSQYRTLSLSYVNLARRFQYAVQGFTATEFFYSADTTFYAQQGLTPFLDRDDALATRTVRGGLIYGIYPLNRYTRVELSAGIVDYEEEYADQVVEELSRQSQVNQYGTTVFNNGTLVPFSVSLVQEDTVFREFGPLAGSTMRLSYEIAPKIGNSLERQVVDGDIRWYQRIAGSGLAAFRIKAFKSWGDNPDFFYYGGNSEMRGYEYLEFVGNQGGFANAELRFPLIEAMLTPIGVLGGMRGVLFANIGGSYFNGQPFKFATSNDEVVRPFTGNIIPCPGDPTLACAEQGPPVTITGFRLRDGRASYGMGLESFILGFPIHFDFSWRTLFNRQWEDALFSGAAGGGSAFRKMKFDVWIGYDF